MSMKINILHYVLFFLLDLTDVVDGNVNNQYTLYYCLTVKVEIRIQTCIELLLSPFSLSSCFREQTRCRCQKLVIVNRVHRICPD